MKLSFTPQIAMLVSSSPNALTRGQQIAFFTVGLSEDRFDDVLSEFGLILLGRHQFSMFHPL